MQASRILPALALACALAAQPAVADAVVARSYAATCASCHGTDGRASGAMLPLAALQKDYIVAQFKAFQAGTRPATIMHQIAKGYTDEQIDLIAGYFAAQKR